MQMTDFVYKRPLPLSIPLRLLDYAIKADTYESVLSALGSGILAAAKRIDRGGEEVADYEVEIVENLLGVAYVACQQQINAIVHAVLRLPDAHTVLHLAERGPSARVLRDHGPRFDSNYSKAEVLWELANYFKHRDEWPRDTWTNPPTRTEHTLRVIMATGLSGGSAGGNLRTGAEALGNTNYSDVEMFQEIIRSWAAEVRENIRDKFGG
jgi:hypothetical protein